MFTAASAALRYFRAMNAKLAACVIALAVAAGTPAFAQSGAPSQTPRPTPNFEADLAGLAHVLGGAHYIRVLCSGKADQRWREQMQKFMNLEGPPGTPRRAVMVQEFNEGYREQEQRYSGCSPDAQAAENQLKAQGGRYSQALAARYRY
jgi:uncharacterized protein (TIGR02301 family)